MRRRRTEIDPRIREVIGAWLVCLAVAAACFGLPAINAAL
jgi:hypothetical protein